MDSEIYKRWCKWCGHYVVTNKPWQQHRQEHAKDTHAEDPAVSKTRLHCAACGYSFAEKVRATRCRNCGAEALSERKS